MKYTIEIKSFGNGNIKQLYSGLPLDVYCSPNCKYYKSGYKNNETYCRLFSDENGNETKLLESDLDEESIVPDFLFLRCDKCMALIGE